MYTSTLSLCAALSMLAKTVVCSDVIYMTTAVTVSSCASTFTCQAATTVTPVFSTTTTTISSCGPSITCDAQAISSSTDPNAPTVIWEDWNHSTTTTSDWEEWGSSSSMHHTGSMPTATHAPETTDATASAIWAGIDPVWSDWGSSDTVGPTSLVTAYYTSSASDGSATWSDWMPSLSTKTTLSSDRSTWSEWSSPVSSKAYSTYISPSSPSVEAWNSSSSSSGSGSGRAESGNDAIVSQTVAAVGSQWTKTANNPVATYTGAAPSIPSVSNNKIVIMTIAAISVITIAFTL